MKNKITKCFIKNENGDYVEINYKELERRRKEKKGYLKNRLVREGDYLIEVSEEIYSYIKSEENKAYYQNLVKKNKHIRHLSIDKKENQNLLTTEIKEKEDRNNLFNGKIKFTKKELEVIKAIVNNYENKTDKELAKSIGISKDAFFYRKICIKNKLKKI